MKYKDVRQAVAKKIKTMRLNAGMNQREFAKRAGVSQKTISNLEDADAHTCQLDKLYLVAQALKIEVWEIVRPDEIKVLRNHNETALATDGLTDEAIDFARAFQELPPEQRAVLEQTAKAFMDSTKKQTQKTG